jgi:hypothetical protein
MSMAPDQSATYCPEDLSLLGQVFDSAVESLPPRLRTAGNRTAIARNILACAATGVRDTSELQLAATMDLTTTAATISHTEALPSHMPRAQGRAHERAQLIAQQLPFHHSGTMAWRMD